MSGAVAPWTHGTAEVSGFRMHYVTAGAGPALVLVHGWPQSWYEWRKVIPALAERFTVIAPDLRGLGDSGKPDGGYDKRTLAADVHALVRHLGFERIGLVGHDWGGAVSYFLAYDHPEMVERMMILDMVPGLFRAGEKVDLAFATRLWHVFFHGGRPDVAEKLVAPQLEAYLRFLFSTSDYNHRPDVFGADDLREYVRVNSLPGTLRAGFRFYAASLREDAENHAACSRKLAMPLRVWGAEALLGDLVPVWRAVAEDVEGGVVERCGHFIPEEKPDFVVREALDFFAQPGAPRTAPARR